MEKTNLENLNRLARLFGTDRLISPEDIEAIRDSLIGVLANNKKEIESLTEETKQAVNSILDKVLNEHDTYLEKTKQIAQEAKSETTEAINSTLKSLEEVKVLCKEVMECKPENGEDADEEYVIGEVLNRIKLPEYKEIVLDDGGAIVDKINSLPVNEENQIDAKHIKNLPEGKGGRVISGGVTRKIVEQMIEAAGGGGSPGGSTTQLQYNNAGAFGGISGATTDGTAVTYTANNLKAADITASGSGGFLIQSNSGTDVGLFGAGGGAGATFYGGVNLNTMTTGSVLFAGASGAISQDNSNFFWDDTNNRLGIGTSTPTQKLEVNGTISLAGGGGFEIFATAGSGGEIQTYSSLPLLLNRQGNGVGIRTTSTTHSLTFGSSSTGIALYNTADQTTNYERVLMQWSANIFNIQASKGGTGTVRLIDVNGTRFQSSGFITNVSGITAPNFFDINYAQAYSRFFNPLAQSSGTGYNVVINPTLTQTGTAGYTALLVNPTETTTGSGSKLLADFQVGGVSKFNVANTGITTITNTTDTASNQVLVLQGDRATPTASDNIYQSYLLSNSSGTQKEVGRISAFIDTVTAGSENGRLRFGTSNSSGTLTNYVELTPSTWRPVSNDGAALGLSTVSWSDLFLASGGVINWNNGNATLTHSTGLLTSSVPIVAPKRVVTTTDDSTAVIDVALTDVYQLTAIANNTTFSFTGTPTDGQNFIIRYKDAGVSKTLTWTGFTAIGVTLPTATTAGKWGYVGVTYNSAASQYHVTAVTTEA